MWLLLLFPPYLLQEKDPQCFYRYFLGSGAKKQREITTAKSPGQYPGTKAHHLLPTLWLENKPCTHRKWESCREVAPSYDIISFECFFCFIRRSAIIIPLFSIPPLENRDNIYVTWQNIPTLCTVIDVVYCCWCWRHQTDNTPLYNATLWEEICSICLDAAFPPRSFALPLARADLWPLSRCRNYPLSRKASSRFAHIPIFLHWGTAGQTRETAAKIWPSGGA